MKCPKCGSNNIKGGPLGWIKWVTVVIATICFVIPGIILYLIWRHPMKSCAECGFMWT